MSVLAGRLVILTGMSGAGKSTALRTFEDLGYYCLDNLPPTLIEPFIQLYRQAVPHSGGVAVVCDVRSGSMFAHFRDAIRMLTEKGHGPEIIFFDCEDDRLVARFTEARRSHPLGLALRIEDAVHLEREQITPLKELASQVIDTTDLSVQQLRQRILGLYTAGELQSRLSVTVLSFGFKFGLPADADFLFDTRFLPNPFYVEDLREHTGNDPLVANYVLSSPGALEFLEHAVSLLMHVLPRYADVHKLYATIAVGCTGGKHRSVVIANELDKLIRCAGIRCLVQHRDIDRV
jgi:RNase adapter protein RapZ